ncbi:24979_t:CDS:2 [Cetraspora pellucida]|uniref:24979_t:CDS:1 n=1 Tax=Cetraspora pellucida TaxID=1433469 RepID=A0A9N9IZG9_9GLOM|nr:24979_t:CDS:2 [Cetraspora pellucida]
MTYNKFEDSRHMPSTQKEVNESEEEIQKALTNSYNSYIPFKSNDGFILNLFHYFIKLFNIHYETAYVVNTLRQYFIDNNADPLNTFNKLIHHQNQSYFTSIIGYFYQFGIGTEISYRLASKFYSRSNIQDKKTSYSLNNSDSLFFNDFIENNYNIGKISLAYLYFYGIGVKEDNQKAFLLCNETIKNNYGLGQYLVGKCFEEGYDVAFKWPSID